MDNTKILLLDRFMRGETSPEEEQQLLAWFREVDSQEDILTFYRQRWHESATKEISEEVQLRMFNQIRDRINTDKTVLQKNDRKQNRRRLLRWGQYAAAVILCVVVGITSHLYTRQSMAEVKEYMVEAEKGQRASVTLPDGTKVWLNSHTELTYNGDYGKGNRQVVLSGEGYFEVAKDSTSRFIVKAGEMEVEALGTTFNVKAYQEDRELTTTLFEGKVRTSIGKDEVILKPDESLSFDKSSRRIMVSDELATYARMWKDNELVFKGETMEEVAVMLDRLYNVKVRFASEKVKRYRFSGVIKNNSLENVIELISLTAPIVYKKVGGEIIIEERK